MLPRISSAAHLSPLAVIVHFHAAICFADQAIQVFGNEIPLCNTLFLELFHSHMLNFCLLALSFQSQNGGVWKGRGVRKVPESAIKKDGQVDA